MTESHLEALHRRTQERLEVLRRHRREVADETPAERARRQEHRAEAVALALSGGRPVTRAIVKAVLALVVADEHPDPPGDPVPPKAPGARTVLRRAKNSNQDGLW